MGEQLRDQIVMTPKQKTACSTTLAIERQAVSNHVNHSKDVNIHVAGGAHKGIVINKQTVQVNDETPAQLCLAFRVFLVSAQTGKHVPESRTLQYWFIDDLTDTEQASIAQEFFRELVSPQEFPRDYVGFIKKVMKLMQLGYKKIKKIEVTLTQLDEIETLPNRPLSADESSLGKVVELTEEKVLELIESAYPNPITAQDIAQEHGWAEEDVTEHLANLQKKGLIKSIEHGAFTRVGQGDTDIQVVKQMPKMIHSKQPTIAIVTAQYCEKLAVDAMIENKETYVRYTTVGESNVYTLGNIGSHRIVCTKLPTVGHTREAITAAGNTTTRLLGTFQKVDYVFLVGVGGGVPHYTDYNKHVRLGDVVISHPVDERGYVYVYCDTANPTSSGSYEFETKKYLPVNLCLQEIASRIKSQSRGDDLNLPWYTYLKEGIESLSSESEQDFKRPPDESDKLYMSIGERDLIEVAHPVAPEGTFKREGTPRIHLAPIASGRAVAREDQIRQQFSSQFGALAFDSEFDAVLESIIGNCRDSFICIRGIADYKDGTRHKEWQPFASLTAASVMKAIICGMDAPSDA